MKMVCVNNGFSKRSKLCLTVGKEYECEEMNIPNGYEEIIKGQPLVDRYVKVTNDKGVTQTYCNGRFRPVKNA